MDGFKLGPVLAYLLRKGAIRQRLLRGPPAAGGLKGRVYEYITGVGFTEACCGSSTAVASQSERRRLNNRRQPATSFSSGPFDMGWAASARSGSRSRSGDSQVTWFRRTM